MDRQDEQDENQEHEKSTRKRTSETTKHAKKTKNPWLKSIATRGLPACDAQAGVKVAFT